MRSAAVTAAAPVRTGGASYITAWASAGSVAPANGGRPASISKATTAAENRSVRASTGAPASCSGEAYCGVPTNIPAAVSGGAVTSIGVTGRASPKSSSFSPVVVRNTFDGLRSRCTMPWPCRTARASSIDGGRAHRVVGRHRAAGQPVGERLAFHQLHRDVGTPVGVAEVEHLADERMDDPRGHPRFAGEPIAGGRIRRVGTQHLQRHAAFEALVERFVDDAHAALAQPADDAEMADDLAGEVRSRRCPRRRLRRGGDARPGRVVEGRGLQEAVALGVAGEQRPDLGLERAIAAARAGQVSVTLGARTGDSLVEQRLHACPPLVRHRGSLPARATTVALRPCRFPSRPRDAGSLIRFPGPKAPRATVHTVALHSLVQFPQARRPRPGRRGHRHRLRRRRLGHRRRRPLRRGAAVGHPARRVLQVRAERGHRPLATGHRAHGDRGLGRAPAARG